MFDPFPSWKPTDELKACIIAFGFGGAGFVAFCMGLIWLADAIG